MHRIDLNDLPKWSIWPARFLGLTPWNIPCRTIEKINQEYEKDKYARCLNYFISANKAIGPEKIKEFEFGLNFNDKLLISIGNELYDVSIQDVL